MKTGQGFMLVYSITSRQSFEAATKLRTNIVRMKEASDFPILLIGNKKDLDDERQVPETEGRELAEKFKVSFIETSAKTNENVNQAFEEIVRTIGRFRAAHPSKKPPKKKGGCTIL